MAGLSRVIPDLAPRFEANRRAFLEELAAADRAVERTEDYIAHLDHLVGAVAAALARP